MGILRVLTATVFLLPALLSAESVRCKSRLIQAGDSRLKVKSLCGEPHDKFQMKKNVYIHRRFIFRNRTTQQNRYLAEEFVEEFERPLQNDHKHEYIRNHDFRSQPVLKTRTGRVYRNTSITTNATTREFWECEKSQVFIEKWSYNKGPDRFIRHLYFQDAKLVKVETGEYGF